MNNKRNKRGPVRAQRNRSLNAEGVYSNSHFMFTATAQVGSIVRLHTRGEDVWEGIFKTFSSSFDVVLEVATLIGKNDSPNATYQIGSMVEKLVFPVSEIVSMTAIDVDTQYATRDTFQTDSGISSRFNGAANREEKELEPWDGELNGSADTPLELDNTANGWDANDMFKKNELEYGVTSTFDHSLRGYTVPLQHSDSPDYKEAEAKANQIANEIESQPSRKARLELENGDEETIYAAVVRPSEPNGKYIPPAKRKGQNSNKAPRTSPPPSSSTQTQTAANNNNNNNASAQTTTSKGAQTSPVPSYAQTPVSNVPHHAPQAAQPPMQAPAQAQTSVPPPAVQNQGHQPRQNHGYRQNGPKGQHMNGESKMMRGPRNVYQTGPPNVPPPVVQQGPPPHAVAYQGADHNNRHREEVKDLQQFSQDFQLGQKDMPPQGPPPQQPPVTEQQNMQPPQNQVNHKPQQEVPVPQPTPSPNQDTALEKMSNTLKNSKLNPNAKEFVLNATKPPLPRTPSTSSLSRPHTPQTPSHPQFIGTNMGPPQSASMMVPMYGMMAGQAPYPQQPQGNRMRKMPANQIRQGECLSSMQVAAATGQPLLAPAPMAPFVYPTAINPAAYHNMHRMYDAPPQLQYMPTQVSQAGPQPGQPQYAQAQPPQGPPQQYQTAPPPQGGVQTHSYLPMCNLIPQPHMLQGMQYLQQVPPPNHHIPLILHNQHQGPA